LAQLLRSHVAEVLLAGTHRQVLLDQLSYLREQNAIFLADSRSSGECRMKGLKEGTREFVVSGSGVAIAR